MRGGVLLVGGSGRIGRATEVALVAAGHPVTSLRRSTPWPEPACGRWVAVVNAAGVGMSSDAPVPADRLREVNTALALRCADWALESEARLVHLGTVLERTPLAAEPAGYAGTKAAAATALRRRGAQGLDLVELWPHLVVGGAGPTPSLLDRIAGSLLAGVPFALRNPGLRRDVVHVEDVGRAVTLAVGATSPPPPGTPLEIGTGVGLPLAGLVEQVADLLESTVRWVSAAGSVRGWEGDLVADPAPACGYLDFEARMSSAAAVSAALGELRRTDERQRA